jgi:Xaa-Pro aminopeptidase
MITNELSINNRIELLRKEMKKEGLSAYIIPSADPHQSEYVSDHYKSRAYISGFTGSAGLVIITLSESGLWTDGRYFIQAERQLEGSEIVLYKMLEPNVPTYEEWLKTHIKPDERIGFDQRLFSVNNIKSLKNMINNDKIEFVGDFDLIERIWSNRPNLPMDKVFYHELEYSGLSTFEKINNIRQEMKKEESQVYILSGLNDIGWLFNIRGNDIAYTPVAYAYAIITLQQATLYIHLEKVPSDIKIKLEEQNVILKPYNAIFNDINNLTENASVIYDPSKLNSALHSKIHQSSSIIEHPELVAFMKARMNETEISNLKNCQIKDCVALVKFLCWLDKEVPNGTITEITAADKLESFRKEQPLFIENSFDTIAGYGANAAMMHYKATEATATTLESRGFFLVDSGGQYYNGTTDITRTIVLGELTDEERHDYTLVVKAHIALNRLVFLHGATGQQLDVIARQPIWQCYMDYKCGTGHSIGYLLGVHEGPGRFRKELIDPVVLEEGMLLTNEPGIYKENKHGIRIENCIIVKEKVNNEFGRFMSFDIISFCPIDLRGIDINMLTLEERDWLNHYHQQVYEKLSPYLLEDERNWLESHTNKI